ncbi:hypothetical protein QBC32DRAFT_380334 [Pseudoneurospora amorphoporcata]|uniref:Carrier domain-containing protein n=1 Tax=Pseudoneurospora amorphoporcata TaxID=241081 RepID=A0AAN6NMP1_9PEZI|nr:hypothetical protein QBC32DRAFT_380334 [Pseudoneurospora amorphoporcata]
MATVDQNPDIALSIANHPPTRLPGPSLLHHLVQHGSETRDNHVPAVDYLAPDGSRISLSYHELHRRSDALAARISSLAGPVTDDNTQLIVPVLIPQCPDLYITLLAILKAGGAFCPLNLDIPLERAKFILNQVSAALIITTPELAEKVPENETGKQLLILTKDVFTSTETVQHRRPTPNNLAYVMYTSGSTGTPKGVPITHDAATQSLLAHDRHIPDFSRFLQFAAPTFDVSVFEIFFPLFRGKTLVSCNRSAMLNDLPGVINELGIDACELTPSVAASLLRKREHAPGLKLLLTIGEMLTQPVVREFGGDDTRKSILWGMYGPTEAAIHCTVQPAFAAESVPGLIGFSFDTVSSFIIAIPEEGDDDASQIKVVPIGEVGELAIGGHQLAPCYLNRPEDTAEAFVSHPAYGLLYRTKDKARMLPDGTMQCMGRIGDGQVKLRGQRIELGEIEHAALRAPGCHSAFAAVIKGILVLFCAVDSVDSMSTTKIEESCKAWLPGFMVPGDIIVMKEFPRLASGKVDRKGLVAEYESMQASGQPKEKEFRDEKERQIYVLVRNILGLVVHPTQSLMHAGMDSLRAIKLASALGKAMGVAIGANEILGARTIRALREVVRDLQAESTNDRDNDGEEMRRYQPAEIVANNKLLLDGRLEDIEAVLPCTPLQTAMLSETTANPRAYCNWLKLKFPEGCTEMDVRSWFLRLAESNEALRTGFVHHGGQFQQVIFKSLDDDSLISVAGDVAAEFSFVGDEDFLRPFRIFFSPPSATSRIKALLQIHHAIYDGWSTDLLVFDLHSLIDDATPNPRPAFRAVTEYYHSAAYRRACNSAREFWAQHLADYQPPSIPELRPDMALPSTVQSHSVHLPSLSPHHVKSVLRELDCTPQVLFQAALAWLWGVYVGSQDVVIGTVTSGRTIPVPGIEEIFGPCIATVPLRTDLAGVRTVRDLLGSVQTVGREVVRHGVLPLKEIKRVAGIRAGQSPFEVLFVYQETLDNLTGRDADKGGKEKVVELEQGRDWLETKLLVEVEPQQGGYDLALTYHTDAFTEAQMAVLGEQLSVLVQAMLDSFDTEVSSLKKVFPRNLLSAYNERPKTLEGVPDLAKAVEAAVERNPDQEALCFAERIWEDGIVEAKSVSYRELTAMANKIAWLLKSQGMEEGDIVAIVMEKSVLLYAGILAILKTGCAYLPLLPSTPVERVKTVFGQAGVRHCLVDSDSKVELKEIIGQVEFIDLETAELDGFSDENLDTPVDPSRIAYIIYTSGSTGVPKGVCVTQLNIVSNLDVLSRIYPSTPGTSRLLQSCSQAFDVSVFEILFAWTQSMTLCSGTNDVLFADLERSIRSLGITHLSMTPTVASLVSPENVPKVEFLVTAGEPMTPAVASKWHKQLWQGYGPSETTNICSVKRMVIPPRHRIRHLGFTFPNTSAFVVYPDTDTESGKLELVPIGGFGELCFGGDQVVKGYLGQDELTSEKFVVHEEWGRVYRSGDLGRMLADGSLVIWGRADEQVKLRGQRVELGEVNAAVQAAAEVGAGHKSAVKAAGVEEEKAVECATLFFKSAKGATSSTGSGQGQIVSFFVPDTHGRHETTFQMLELDHVLKSKIRSIFQSVEARVPSYMIPSFIIPLSKLPITASGKLNRRLLEESFTSLTQEYLAAASPSIGSGSSDNDDDDYSGEWSETESKVAEIVYRIFAVDRSSVQRWTPLTAFGLDSISAIELSKQLAANLGGKRLAISAILRNATVARIALAMSESISSGSAVMTPAEGGAEADADTEKEKVLEPLVPEELALAVMKRFAENGKNAEKVLPCTPLQEGMLAASVGRGRGAYVNKMLLKLGAVCDVEPLRRSWAKACQRQGILRTAFVSTEDSERPMIQVVLEAGSWEVPWLEFDVSSSDDLDKVIAKHVSTLSEPVDSFEPPISLAIIRGSGEENKFLSFICHHALYDGVAIQRLLFEVEHVLVGNGVELPPAPEYEPFLRESLALARAPETQTFWKEQLSGLRPRLLTKSFRFSSSSGSPADSPDPAPALLTTPIPTPLSHILTKTKHSGVSLLSLVQASWATVLSVLLRTEDVCFGNVLSGRTLPIERIDELVAPCFNTVPVRMRLDNMDLQGYGGSRNLDLVKALGRLGARILEGSGFVSLRKVQGLVKGGGKMFDTLLLLQQGVGGSGYGSGGDEMGDSVWEVVRDEGGMDVPIVVEFVPDAKKDELLVNLHLEGGHFPKVFADLILHLLFTTLDNFLQYPASHVWRFDTLPASLKEKLIQLPFDDTEASSTSSSNGAQASDAEEEWSDLETRIRNVLTSLMANKDRRIARQTTIYQLGLDSISAVQIASMLRRDLGQEGLEVNASDVIAHPSCAGLTAFLESQKGNNKAAATEPKTFTYDVAKFQEEVKSQLEPQLVSQSIEFKSVERVLPCTPLQSGMWMQFVRSAQGGGRDYLNFLEYHIDKSKGVGLQDLNKGWNMLFLAQPILRTGFVAVEHDDSAFAMVQYHPEAVKKPVIAAKGHPFEVEKWRSDLASGILGGKQPVPWGVALIERHDGLTMHVGMHHVLYDAHSLQVLMAELTNVMSAGEPLIALKSTETETAVAVVDILTQIETSRETAEKFWKEQAEKTVINSFPVMTPLKEPARHIMQVERLQGGGMSLPELEKAAAESGYSLQVLIQASWARVLSAYLGEASVTFGVVLSGRNTEVTRDAIFPCITTLPVIAANVASNNREMLEGMMKYNAELYKQQHQPLAKIQQWLGRLDTRLFDTLVVYQKFSSNTLTDGPQAPWSLVEDAATIDYPVSIEVEPQANGEIKYAVTFFDDVLPREQAQLLLKQFQAMVEFLALHPSADEDGLLELRPELFAILPPEKPVLPVPDNIQFLHQFVEVQALKTPEKTALFFAGGFDSLGKPIGKEWSYRELDANGNRVANMLSEHVKVGDIVAVYFDKCPEAFFAILGVLKAGCSFVALDPGAPEARKEFILKDSGATAFLTTIGKAKEMDFVVEVPVLGVDLVKLQEVSATAPVLDRELLPSDAAYCLYTSGTTGTPKGCEITHDNTVQCMLAFQHIFIGHWQDTSRWLQFASLHFDVSVLEQYWSWSVGITLVGAPKDLILEDLAGTISRLEITHIDLTPSLARLLHPDDVPSLCRGVFITGGESLKQEILDVWGEKAVIYNFYGPTEATIGVTVYPRVPRNGRASNIGRQFVNVGSCVLKPGTDRPVLRGAVGELCVSGKLVGKGYLGREDLTKERFPILVVQGKEEKVYRTGDLVRVLHDDCFDFLGRADDQVKLRGQRLEIGEINHSIKTGVEQVQDVATIVVRNEKAGKDFLVAFVTTVVRTRAVVEQQKLEVIKDGKDTAELVNKVRQACRAKLPGYMVPTYVVRLPYIPLSANNKAEIKELKRLFSSLTQEELVSLSPSASGATGSLTPTGQKVASVLSEMLAIDVSVVTPSTSIFELGLDSISALRLSRALKRSGFAQASPSLILSHPLITDLSHALDTAKAQSNTAHVAAAKQLVQACQHRHLPHVCKELGVSREEVEYVAPCTGLQAGMIARRDHYYNLFRLELAEEVDAARLERAWNDVVEEYPILRTKFVQTTEGFVQVALKPKPTTSIETLAPWEEKQLWEDGGPNLELTSSEVISEKRRRWEWGNGEGVIKHTIELQLMKITKADLSRETRYLVLHIFHGVYDANSLEMILQKVAAAYHRGGSTGRGEDEVEGGKEPSFLEALYHGPLQSFAHSKSFWLSHLKNARPEPSFVVPEDASTQVWSRERTISFTLQHLTKTLGVTSHSVLQAAWVAALAKQFGVRNPTIGVIVSGRAIELEGAERVVGPLFNTLPFHASLGNGRGSGGVTYKDLVKSCHEWNSKMVEWQHVPLRVIQKWCRKSGKGLFEVLFSFQQEDMDARKPQDGGVGKFGAEEKQKELWTVLETRQADMDADYPLALEATLTSDGEVRLLIVAQEMVFGTWEVARDVVDGLMEGLVVVLTEMGEDPEGVPLVVGGDGVDEVMEQEESGQRDNDVEDANERTWRGDSEFVWTEEAKTIREQIATLAEVAVDSVTETTSILELGLDSIDTIKLSARLRELGVSIKPSELMKGQTIEGLVYYLKEQKLANDKLLAKNSPNSWDKAAHKMRQEHSDAQAILPATPLQDGMVAEMIHSDFQLYFNHDIMEVEPHVDMTKLKRAWQMVIAASPILRTSFSLVDDPTLDFAYFQVVHHGLSNEAIKEMEIESEKDLSNITESATTRARKAGGGSGLFQLVFATLGDRKFVILSIAHALYDGWSLALLHHDVQAAYEGRYEVRPWYQEYLEEILRSGDDRSASFWSGYLAGAKPTFYPQLSPNQSKSSIVYRHETVSQLDFAKIRSFTKQHAITLQTLGQACHAAVLATATRSLDVMFGVVLSGRAGSEEAEQLMFPTMNTVAVRSVLHGDVSGWLRYMQSVANDIGGREHFPLRKMQRLVEGGGQLFNTLFVMQRGVPGGTIAGTGEVLVKSVGGSSAVEYPVCVEMEVVAGAGADADGGEKLVWRTACDSRFVDGEMGAKELGGRLDKALRYLVESAHGKKNVLEFVEGGKMSICGLGGFTPATGDDTTASNNDDDDVEEEVNESASWSELEERIRSVLAEVAGLEVSEVQKGNNIYHLGLDSISAIKVVSLLRKQGISIPLRQLLKAKSISAMAQAVTVAEEQPVTVSTESPAPNDNNNSTAIKEPSLHTHDINTTHITALLCQFGIIPSSAEPISEKIEAILPATAMQVHMLSVWQNTQGDVFHATFTYRLTGNVSKSTLSSAWKSLVVEFPILRTIFLANDQPGPPVVQVILRPDAIAHWNSEVVEEDDPKRWSSLSTKDQVGLRQPFNSMAGQQADEGDWILNLKIHHALYDALSLPMMVSRFTALCAGASITGKPGTSFRTLEVWKGYTTRRTRQSVKAKKFWTEYLAGAESTPIDLTAAYAPTATSASAKAEEAPSRQSTWLPDFLRPLVDGLSRLLSLSGTIWQSSPAPAPEQQRAPWPRRVSLIQHNAMAGISRIKKLCAAAGVSIQALFFAAYARFVSETAQGKWKDVVMGVYLANRSSESELSEIPYPTLCLVPLRVRIRESDESLVDMARHIQEDLYKISDPENIGVGLWEIEEWTGVVVDGFVNFLSVPLSASDSSGNEAGNERQDQAVVKMELMSEEEVKGMQVGEAGEEHEFVVPREMENDAARKAYPSAIDVEVAIDGDAVTMGVFGSRKKMGPDGGRFIVSKVVEALTAL